MAENKKYEVGDDFKDRGASMMTFGITEIGVETHSNKIEVYGDAVLRDRILELLNKDYKEEVLDSNPKERTIAEVVLDLKATEKRLGEERDKLRDLEGEVEQLLDATQNGLDDLGSAIESLSQYV